MLYLLFKKILSFFYLLCSTKRIFFVEDTMKDTSFYQDIRSIYFFPLFLFQCVKDNHLKTSQQNLPKGQAFKLHYKMKLISYRHFSNIYLLVKNRNKLNQRVIRKKQQQQELMSILIQCQNIIQLFVKKMLYSRTHIPAMKQSKGYALSRNHNKENVSNNMEVQKKVHKQAKKDTLPSLVQRFSHKKVQKDTKSRNWEAELKDAFAENVQKQYGEEIFCCLIERCEGKGEFLGRHAITPGLRAKMVDWMIQVLSSYKMSEESFFRSVQLMNIYFSRTSKNLEMADLHLIGATCMFMATKAEEIYPIKLSALYDKICRKKFAKEQILSMEEEILQTLAFDLQQTTLYDLVQHLKGEVSILQKHKKYYDSVLLYLAKMVMHSYELAQYNSLELAVSIVFLGLKALQQVESVDCSIIEEVRLKCRVEKEMFISTSEIVLCQAKNFRSLYPNLSNLKRFHQISSSPQY